MTAIRRPRLKRDRYLYARIVLNMRMRDARAWANYHHRNPPKSVRALASSIMKWKRTERVLGQGPKETRRDLAILEAEEIRLSQELKRTRGLIRILAFSLELTPKADPPP